MFLICVLHDGHERVRQDSDQDRNDEEVTNDQEDSHDDLPEDVVFWPGVPSSRTEAHHDLKAGKVRMSYMSR